MYVAKKGVGNIIYIWQYEKWEKKNNMLILSGKSIGNHETSSFTDTLTIEKLTKNELILKKGSLTINDQKQ